jgi:hypothetical protein
LVLDYLRRGQKGWDKVRKKEIVTHLAGKEQLEYN